MSLMDLGRYLVGQVTVEARGPALERFINLCMTRYIHLQNLRWRDDRLLAELPLPDFFRLRSILRKTHTRLRVRRRWGWPFLWRRARRRKVLLGGALAFLVAAYAATQFIWFVEIRGLEELDSKEVRREASALGLRPGVYRGGVDVDGFERSLRVHLPETSAILLRFVGTRAIIEVVEREMPPSDRGQHDPADLVALRPGRVRTVSVYMGSAAVSEGQLVEEGETLIRGLLVPGFPTGALTPDPTAAVPVRARGMVKAETWREVFLVVPLTAQDRRPTGERISRYGLKWGRQDIIMPGRAVSFTSCQIERRSWPILTGRILGGPVEWVRTTYTALAAESVRLSAEAAADAAQESVASAITQGLGPGSQVLEVRRQVVWETSEELGVRFMISLLEDIAVPQAAAAPPPAPQTGQPGAASP